MCDDAKGRRRPSLTRDAFPVRLIQVGRNRIAVAIACTTVVTVGALAWGCGARTGLGTCFSDGECNDDNVCTVDTCVFDNGDGAGDCSHVPAPAGTACDDGNSCTSTDVCDGQGKCVGMANDTCLPPAVDPTCEPGCASGTPDFPAAIALVPPGLPSSCSSGFEMNTPPESTFTLESKSPGGAEARSIDVEIATYKAPDHITITGIDGSGATYTLVDLCHLQTATYGDPTDGCTRPPDDSIRQYTVSLKAGTTSLTVDMTGACTPTYVRVLGLCDFDVTPLFSGCGFRAIP